MYLWMTGGVVVVVGVVLSGMVAECLSAQVGVWSSLGIISYWMFIKWFTVSSGSGSSSRSAVGSGCVSGLIYGLGGFWIFVSIAVDVIVLCGAGGMCGHVGMVGYASAWVGFSVSWNMYVMTAGTVLFAVYLSCSVFRWGCLLGLAYSKGWLALPFIAGIFYAALGAWLLFGCAVMGLSSLSESLSVVGLLLGYSVQSNVQMLLTALFGVTGCWVKVYIFIAIVLLWAAGLLEGIHNLFLNFAVTVFAAICYSSYFLCNGGLSRVWRVSSSGASGSSRLSDYHGLAGHNALLSVVCFSWLGLAVTVSGLLKLFFGLDGWCVLMTLFLGIPTLMVALIIIYVLLLVASLDSYAVAVVLSGVELPPITAVIVGSLLIAISVLSWMLVSHAFHVYGLMSYWATGLLGYFGGVILLAVLRCGAPVDVHGVLGGDEVLLRIRLGCVAAVHRWMFIVYSVGSSGWPFSGSAACSGVMHLSASLVSVALPQ